jgi:uncharacterized membrane protein
LDSGVATSMMWMLMVCRVLQSRVCRFERGEEGGVGLYVVLVAVAYVSGVFALFGVVSYVLETAGHFALIQARTSVHKYCGRLRATPLPRDWPRNCKYNRK